MEKYEIKISEEDMNKLEKLHYEVEARTNLFVRLTTAVTKTTDGNAFYDKFMDEYTALYKDYCDFKDDIERKYKPEAIAETAKSWYADFIKRVVVFEV